MKSKAGSGLLIDTATVVMQALQSLFLQVFKCRFSYFLLAFVVELRKNLQALIIASFNDGSFECVAIFLSSMEC